jgi:peroxiredoxin
MSHNLKLALSLLIVLVGVFLLFRTGGQLLDPFLSQSGTPAAPPASTAQGIRVGSVAPYFELSDLSGDRVRLSDFLHTPLLVVFWSTSVSDAQDQIKILDDYKIGHPRSLFKIMTVNIQEDKSAVRAFIGRGKYDIPVLLDGQGAVGGLYGTQTLPTSFFVDDDGIVRVVHVGVMSERMIDESSESILISTGRYL